MGRGSTLPAGVGGQHLLAGRLRRRDAVIGAVLGRHCVTRMGKLTFEERSLFEHFYGRHDGG